jgi:hypothetical protein
MPGRVARALTAPPRVRATITEPDGSVHTEKGACSGCGAKWEQPPAGFDIACSAVRQHAEWCPVIMAEVGHGD